MQVKVKVGDNARLIVWDMKESIPLGRIFQAAEELGGVQVLRTAWLVFADNSDDMFMVVSTVEMPWVDAYELYRQFGDEGIEEPEVEVWVIEL